MKTKLILYFYGDEISGMSNMEKGRALESLIEDSYDNDFEKEREREIQQIGS
jgi:hypothetical protein